MTTDTATIRIYCENKDRPGTPYVTDVATDFQIQEIIDGLGGDGFLTTLAAGDRWQVLHARTGNELTPATTLAAARVEDGDQLIFIRDSHGA